MSLEVPLRGLHFLFVLFAAFASVRRLFFSGYTCGFPFLRQIGVVLTRTRSRNTPPVTLAEFSPLPRRVPLVFLSASRQDADDSSIGFLFPICFCLRGVPGFRPKSPSFFCLSTHVGFPLDRPPFFHHKGESCLPGRERFTREPPLVLDPPLSEVIS